MIFHKTKKDILNGNLAEQILIFTIPVCGAYLLQLLYQIVDSIVLGRFASVEAMAAIGGSPLMVINILLNIINGIASGLMIVVAQNYGRGNHEKVNAAVKTGMFIALVFGGIISIVSAIAAKPLLHAMNCPEETISLSLIYMYLYFLGLVPFTVYTFGTYILRATGDSKTSSMFTVVMTVVKIILDVLLTAVFKMGIWGVSISTLVSYVVCGAVVLVVLHRTPFSYHYDIKEFGFDLKTLEEIFKIGVPVAVQSAVFAITNAYASIKVNAFGTNSVAAYSIYNNIDNFYWSFTNAIGAALITIVGQNYGNKNMKRVKLALRYGIIIHFVATIIFGALEYIYCGALASIFTTDVEVIDITKQMVQAIAVSYSTYVLVEMISSTLKGCSDSMNSMVIAIIGICVVRFLYLYMFEFENAIQVLYCYPISWGITSLIYLIYYLFNDKYRLRQDN